MKKNVKIPSKQTINLMIREKNLSHPTRLIPILILIILGANAFAQFAVIRRLNQVKQAEAEWAQMCYNLQMIEDSYADYDEVKAEYNRYTYQNFDRSIPDRLQILDMLEQKVFSVCTAHSLSITKRTVSMTLGGLDLAQTSELIASLRAEPMVEDVRVSSSTSSESDYDGGGSTTSTVMTVILKDPTTIPKEEPAGVSDGGAEGGGE